MRRLLHSTLLLAATFIAGCANNGADSLDRSLVAYEGGRYEESLQLAEEAKGAASTSQDSLQSSYLAGMSAFRLGRHSDAVRWLEEPARATDGEHRWMAGQANVTLGSSYLALGRKGDAARSFSRAGDLLSGEEAMKARLAAGNAYRELGDQRASDAQFRLAGVPTSGPTAPSAGTSTPTPASDGGAGAANGNPASQVGPFVLQAGAFKDRAKADRRAAEVRARAKEVGLGEPKVMAKRAADGSTMYVVQFGRFGDRRAAESALGRFGASGVVVGRPAA